MSPFLLYIIKSGSKTMEVEGLLRKTRLYISIFLVAVTILCSACGTMVQSKTSSTVPLSSGTENQDYEGVAQTVVPKNLKLSEKEQKNGIQKVPILSSTGQLLMPEVQVTHTVPAERQVDASAKPHL